MGRRTSRTHIFKKNLFRRILRTAFLLMSLTLCTGCGQLAFGGRSTDGFYQAEETEGKTGTSTGKTGTSTEKKSVTDRSRLPAGESTAEGRSASEKASAGFDDGSDDGSDDGTLEATQIYVHVCGAVKKPGLYTFAAGSRAGDAVEAAGGFKKSADRDAINLAAVLTDGQQICVPESGQRPQGQGQDEQSADNPALAEGSGSGQSEGAGSGQSEGAGSGRAEDLSGGTNHEKVNINTADAAALTSLNGVGEAKAEAIISYRQEHGAFAAPEDICNVPGIGEGIYKKIKDSITV